MEERSLTTVLKQMIDALPDDQAKFGGRLMTIRQSALFTAPEAMRERWWEAGLALAHHFPPPDQLNDWQRKIVEIFMGTASRRTF